MPVVALIKKYVVDPLRIAVLLVSAGVIVLISLDVFAPGVSVFAGGMYSRVQLWVCMLYLLDFFVELWVSENRRHYLATHFLYFLISIPYTFISESFGIDYGPVASSVLHFMPTARAALALAIVVGYVSSNRIIGLFASYVSILLLVVYFSSLIFFECEKGVNPGVESYWTSLWWCMLQATTLGASFYARTIVGKSVAIVLSCMGILMFPIFTVYLTSMVKKYIKRNSE